VDHPHKDRTGGHSGRWEVTGRSVPKVQGVGRINRRRLAKAALWARVSAIEPTSNRNSENRYREQPRRRSEDINSQKPKIRKRPTIATTMWPIHWPGVLGFQTATNWRYQAALRVPGVLRATRSLGSRAVRGFSTRTRRRLCGKVDRGTRARFRVGIRCSAGKRAR